MSRSNQWFVLGDGIAREVITADIQRYLGPDALVRPGTGTGDYEGRPGYWITAYRTLTSQMIQDLKLDSQRWAAEKDRDQRGHGSGVAYQDSRTHASRQHYGPTESYATSTKSAYPASTYSASESPHYTTTPTAAYPTHQAYQAPSTHSPHTAPRTDPYANYGQQQPAGRGEYAGYPAAAPAYPTYQQQPPQDPYRPTPTPAYTTPSTAAPGYYIASDGRQYPLSQQPQRQPPAGQGRRGA